MKKRSLVTSLLVLALGVTLFGPATVFAKPGKGKGHGQKEKHVEKVKKHSPPPQAPAHGYRHKHEDGTELSYDSNLGAYLVVGHPDIYFQNGLYVTLSEGVWKVTASLGGEWRPDKEGEIPVKLKEYKIKAKKVVEKSKAPKGKKK